MRKKRRRQSAAAPQRLFEQDWQAFTAQFPEFLDQIVYCSPQTALPKFGHRGDEPAMGLNAVAVFEFCVWQQAHSKGNAEFRNGLLSLFLAEAPKLIELRDRILRPCTRADEEGK